ncbi:hypothetical protein [Nocardioides sp. 503]|uniref:hypothetical protein n=1 Tax=Nocardioides sp. 503 TaxID=2508326 RepID=UPI0010703408|nr:hypothetical protein [Nocardioides sp. 503]
MDAGRGADLVEAFNDGDAGCGYLGEENELVIKGGRGDDRFRGGWMPDILLGGRGDDVAVGGRGEDRCVAERTFRCEQ